MRIKKAKSIMGLGRQFFDCRDVDIRVKYQIYTAGPLNTLLWGCEGWNTSKKKKKASELSSHFHKVNI
jgi:hypothetical protein